MTTDNKTEEEGVDPKMGEPKPEKNNHATIIGTWFKSEMFWMGVAASTLSTGIIAMGAVVAALITGLVELESVIITLFSFVAVISVAALILWLIPAARRTFDRIKSVVVNNENAHASPMAAGIAAVVSILGLIFSSMMGMF